ncbi:MAG: hypothetical protein P0S95_04115 [Rhabdochlamydiaceae bacterium]|nr:hypothetical protein [Candidatus Amphrikana amoebophyrae]
MVNPNKLEDSFEDYINDISSYAPDGVIEVDIFLLKQLGLLHHNEDDEKILQSQFPFYFHVVETDEKVTLFNSQFVVWIVPQIEDEVPVTLTLIALLNDEEHPNLEMIFSTSGIYNSPKCVLKVLRYYLTEVIDTEQVIDSIAQ